MEKQISFFVGGELRPFSMQEIATELGFAESTISRAVSNKYIECNLGIFPLKFFFTNAVDKDLSSSQIKSYIKSLVDYENTLAKSSAFLAYNIPSFTVLLKCDGQYRDWETDRKSTRLNSSHRSLSRMPSSA